MISGSGTVGILVLEQRGNIGAGSGKGNSWQGPGRQRPPVHDQEHAGLLQIQTNQTASTGAESRHRARDPAQGVTRDGDGLSHAQVRCVGSIGVVEGAHTLMNF
jgi:hypothetical protein